MATYNGHKNWNHWNVSLWINNDEKLWQEAVHFTNYTLTKADAAHLMLNWLKEYRGGKTPDGAPYSVSSLRAAMKDFNK